MAALICLNYLLSPPVIRVENFQFFAYFQEFFNSLNNHHLLLWSLAINGYSWIMFKLCVRYAPHASYTSTIVGITLVAQNAGPHYSHPPRQVCPSISSQTMQFVVSNSDSWWPILAVASLLVVHHTSFVHYRTAADQRLGNLLASVDHGCSQFMCFVGCAQCGHQNE